MIFDWIENCKQILQTKHFPNTKGYETINMNLQHLVLFKYMEQIEHKTKEEIKLFWLTTDSPLLRELPEDDKEQWVNVEFEKLWSMRNKSIIDFTKQGAKIYNYPIYQEEVDYINSLNCDTWIRQALFLMLGCAKHNRSGLVKFNYATTAWIEKIVSPDKVIRDKIVKIGKVNQKYDLYSITGRISKKGYRSNWLHLNFAKDKGTVCAIVYSPNSLVEYLDLIQEKIDTCPKCGVTFTKSSKAQTNLCKDCYVKYRREKKTMAMKQLREKESQQKSQPEEK